MSFRFISSFWRCFPTILAELCSFSFLTMSRTHRPGEQNMREDVSQHVVSLTNGTGDRVATKGGEISTEFVRDGLAANHGAHRVSVAQTLPHGDNVRDQAVLHEAPHVVPRPPQAGLDLVSNDETSVLSNNPRN